MLHILIYFSSTSNISSIQSSLISYGVGVRQVQLHLQKLLLLKTVFDWTEQLFILEIILILFVMLLFLYLERGAILVQPPQ